MTDISLGGLPVFWATIKAALIVCIPVWAVAYAREARRESECRQIQAILQKPTDIDWAMSHPKELVERNRAEARFITPMLRDLQR
jgi:hypothetical protein